MRSNRIRLNNGITMPVMGLGTYTYPYDGNQTQLAVQTALQMGYRHFDTAQVYGSEAAVGYAITQAILDQTIDRGDVFVTSKLWGSDHHDPVSALKRTLQKLSMEFVDMYLVHWPLKLKPWANYAVPNEEDFDKTLDMDNTWAAMERCLDLGLCSCIGVSNFSTTKILSLLDFASVPPALNQVEMHPMWRQEKLRGVCADNNIHVSAYSPLGGPGNLWGSTAVVKNPLIQSIALKHHLTPAQVALNWGLSKGCSLIAKSFSRDRMQENIQALNFELDGQDLAEIDKLDERKIMRADVYVNDTTSPYKTIEQLWDGEI